MSTYDRVIASCTSWEAFFDAACALPTKRQQGAAFERLTQLYLRTQPEYASHLDEVWLLSEVPASVCEDLRLPKDDEGIDLIARTRNGDYWAIQSKFRKDKEHRLSRSKLSTFTSLAFHTCQGISLAVVAHTCAKPVKKHDLLPNTVEIGLDRWLQLTEDDWQRIKAATSGKTARPRARDPLPHQREAIAAAQQHFVQDEASRGRLIMPCGTGKSLTAFWIAQTLEARTILVAVPSLALIRQSLTDWTREYLASGKRPEWLVVCSDESTGKLERDEFVGSTYDLGIDATTDPEKIAAFFAPATDATRIVFTTYQSGATLTEGLRRAGRQFDLGIFDEAHKTVGVKSKPFAALLFDEKVPISRRIFMTATERVLSGRNDDVLSMDDPGIYGKQFYVLSFKRAIADKLISDYRVLTVTISDEQIKRLVEENRLLNLDGDEMAAADAAALAAGVALKRAVVEHNIKHAISFHRSIRRAKDFAYQQDALNKVNGLGPIVENGHISGEKSAGERADLLRRFASSERALLTNARCLTEGVDVPAIDCVLFADPKQSTVDIVQASGRALRISDVKKCGCILLPIVVPSGMSFEEFAETTEFRQVAKTIAALSIQDERIAEEFRAIDRGERSSGRVITIEGDVPVGMRIEAEAFAEKINTKVWERVGKANWRRFEDAREYARSLGLQSATEWHVFVASGQLPSDIPTNPNKTYQDEGWQGMGDWLGTGNIAPQLKVYRPFEQARTYVRALGLGSGAEWRAFVASNKLPNDIPATPHQTYAVDGWQGMGDWLGTGTIASRLKVYRPFEQARAYARSLGLRSRTEWSALFADGKLPSDIPAAPHQTYKDDGWQGMGDWLGTGTIASQLKVYRPFEQARAYARSLGLRSNQQWRSFAASGRLPSDIPANPYNTYAESGWQGWGDWLGTGTISNRLRQFRPFEQAREYARSLGLRSGAEWRAFATSGKLPSDIPANPQQTYTGDGWQGMGDWLGTGTIAPRLREYRPFEQAREYARSLGLRSNKEWQTFVAGGNLPSDIPANTDRVYAESGWQGWGDWLGTGTISNRLREFRPFEQARAYARSLGLRSQAEWRAFVAGGKLPSDIPASPDRTYAENGWQGFGDWLGTGTIATRLRMYRAFEQAREYARSLGLQSAAEWHAFAASGKLPSDIPANPKQTYTDDGWQGMGDWLGTGTIATHLREYRPFEQARAYARSLGLRSNQQWRSFAISGKLPSDIPRNPNRVYSEDGWQGMGDWLGYEPRRARSALHDPELKPSNLSGEGGT